MLVHVMGTRQSETSPIRAGVVRSWHRLGAVLTLCAAGLVLPCPAEAQTGTLPLEAYLHGSGGTTNPPTLTVDLLGREKGVRNHFHERGREGLMGRPLRMAPGSSCITY